MAGTGLEKNPVEDRTGPSRWSTTERAVVAALTLAVAAIASYRIGRASFWLDEAATVAISGLGLDDLVRALRLRELPAGGLYLVLAHGWIRVWGDSEAAVRSLSVIFAALTVPVFYAVARRLLVGPTARAGAVAVLVASPFFVFAARDARMYSLALLLTTASTYCFLRLVDSDGERADRWWIAYAVVSTAAVYSHLFCVFVVLAHGVSMVALPRRSVPLRRLVRAWVTVGVLLTPLGYYIARHRASNVDWVGPLSLDQVGEYADLLVGSRLNTVVAAVVVCVCAAVVARVALSSGRSRALWLLCVGGALLVVPVVAALTVSVAKPLFVDRYLIVTVPGFALVVGAVIDRMRRQRLVITIAVVLVIGALSYRSIDRAVAPAPKEDWRAAAAFVGARIQPGDAIVVGPDAFYGFGHYAARDPRLADVESEWPGGPWAVRWIRSDDRDLSSRVPTSARTWVVVRGDPDALQEGWRPPPLERFRTHVAGGDIELVVRFENVSVFRYEPDGAG